ncbi:hypothetical protein OG792_26930 [Micromonospora sp. NBC_01699]|uniref:hypothetical protein n=1 Tax=Micromonospora sp. NBC_01699 TaxID=2975984 RepID=UPI002E2A39AB|nr:hypothetical protein [Micromonospora sp. NBC_01699]
MRLKRIAATMGVLALTTAGNFLAAPTASAAPATHPPAAALSCYNPSTAVEDGDGRVPNTGWWTTTNRCVDINFRYTTGPAFLNARVCFRNGACNDVQRVNRGQGWEVIASNVLDGTQFYVAIDAGASRFAGALAF